MLYYCQNSVRDLARTLRLSDFREFKQLTSWFDVLVLGVHVYLDFSWCQITLLFLLIISDLPFSCHILKASVCVSFFDTILEREGERVIVI